MPDEIYNPAERAERKAQARAADAAHLAARETSRADLRERNGLVSSLDPSKARLVRRRVSLPDRDG